MLDPSSALHRNVCVPRKTGHRAYTRCSSCPCFIDVESLGKKSFVFLRQHIPRGGALRHFSAPRSSQRRCLIVQRHHAKWHILPEKSNLVGRHTLANRRYSPPSPPQTTSITSSVAAVHNSSTQVTPRSLYSGVFAHDVGKGDFLKTVKGDHPRHVNVSTLTSE